MSSLCPQPVLAAHTARALRTDLARYRSEIAELTVRVRAGDQIVVIRPGRRHDQTALDVSGW